MGGGSGAVGGAADSELTWSDSSAEYLSVTSNATGGAGGATDTGAAGDGGFATATASGTSSTAYDEVYVHGERDRRRRRPDNRRRDRRRGRVGIVLAERRYQPGDGHRVIDELWRSQRHRLGDRRRRR